MSDEQDVQYAAPKGHYSGKNKIPTVDKFIQSLDKDKKNRDAQIDAELSQRQNAAGAGGDAVPHTPQKPIKGEKKVTDPVTGSEVEVNSFRVPRGFH